MSDTSDTTERGNVTIQGGIDLSNTSYYDPDTHGPMHDNNGSDTDSGTDTTTGETVSGSSTDDLGAEQLEAIPSHIDPSKLSAVKREIIKTAAVHRNANLTWIAQQVGCDPSYVSTTLRDEWLDRSPNKSHGNNRMTSENVEEVRTRLLDGENSTDIESEFPVSKSTMLKHARGDTSLGESVSVSPVEYNNGTHSWEAVNGEHTDDESGETEGTDDESGDIEETETTDHDALRDMRLAASTVSRTSVNDETRNFAELMLEMIDEADTEVAL